MERFFEWFYSTMVHCFNALNGVRITVGSYDFGYGWMLVAFIVLGIVIANLWKGARM